MTDQTAEMFSDNDLKQLMRSVEADDYHRIDPPEDLWDAVLANAREISEAEAVVENQRWYQNPAVLRVAAVVALIVGMSGIVVGVLNSQADVTSTLATAALDDEGLPVATDSRAWATIVCEGENCRVDVEFTSVPDAGDEMLELWVIDANVAEMYSLGEVTGTGSFDLPAGVNHNGFPVVDISVEPRDGDETHSGQSVLRGIFESNA